MSHSDEVLIVFGMTSAFSASAFRLLRSPLAGGYGLAALYLATGCIGVVPAAGAVARAAAAPQVVAAADPAKSKGGKADSDDDDDDDDDRFPQPVRVGDLIGRAVIAPEESQNLIGHVSQLFRNKDGDLQLVMTYGGYFGSAVGSRFVCVPVDDLALTGVMIQAKDIDAGELAKLPTCDGKGGTPLAANEIIKVNLAKPAH